MLHGNFASDQAITNNCGILYPGESKLLSLSGGVLFKKILHKRNTKIRFLVTGS